MITSEQALKIIEKSRVDNLIQAARHESLQASFRQACLMQDPELANAIREQLHALMDVMLDGTATLMEIIRQNPKD